ncbi:MAG TPA: hypothetical protein VM308_04130 [Sphingomicrobium sp.]|nr:hypothetical protein [Sphingomicrobium sp.]
MKLLLLPALLFSATAAAAQPTIAPQAVPAVWDPVAPYITAGQDEPGYRAWYMADPTRPTQVRAFNAYLVSSGVGGILPTWQLLRTATSWRECGQQPFEVPPAENWVNIVQTLRYIRDHVIPAIGPVEPVSVYRNPVLNICAGGAPESAHKTDSAIDMVPLRPITREALMAALCDVHSTRGPAYRAGLGFYAFVRFHVDSMKFRRWNMDPAVAQHCPPIIQPEDVASVAQPPAAAPPPPLAAPGAGATVTPERGQRPNR